MAKICSAMLILGLLAVGCGDGCKGDDKEAGSAVIDDAEKEEAAEPLGEQVVAVARLLRFNERHFDLRHWRTEAVQAGLFDDSMGPDHHVGEMPTAQFRLFVEELLGDEASRIRWDGHLDVAVWKPETAGSKWRWAVSIPRADGEELKNRVDWTGESFYRVAEGDNAELVPVFIRDKGGDADQSYYVSEIDTPRAVAGSYNGRALTVSNFPQGAARVGEAIALTGESGNREAEVYVWPRRWGIADRYRQAAEAMEQQIATNAHDMLPARVSLLQLQTQIYRALGNSEVWPEVARITLQTDRGGDASQGGSPARRADLDFDLPADQGTLAPALWSALRESNLRRGPRASGAVGEIGLSLRPREIEDLAQAVLPPHWLRLLSVRGAGTRDLLIKEFEDMLLHNRGPTTVAFYPSPVPTGLTAEVFIGWRALDRDELIEVARRFHRRMMRDYWMPLFNYDQFATRGTTEAVLGGDDVTLHEKTFELGHGLGEVGVCWTVRGQEYLSYYGAVPCDRLQEVADFPEETASGPALGYRGSIQGLIDKLYILPGDHAHDIFGDLQISLGAVRYSQERFSISTTIAELDELAKIIDGIPHLARYWAPSVVFDPAMVMLELSLDQATYQEPGLMTVGVPGMGGMLPVSFLLGMPFSFPPTPPSTFREIYFADPDDSGGDHVGHSHSH